MKSVYVDYLVSTQNRLGNVQIKTIKATRSDVLLTVYFHLIGNIHKYNTIVDLSEG